jgi:cysteine desulfurase
MERYYFDWAATAIPDSGNPDIGNPADGDSANGDSADGDSVDGNYADGNRADLSVPFANPSSIHAEGKAARQALEDARRRCAGALGVRAEEIYFTSGGTESNAIVLFSLLRRPGILRIPGLHRSSVRTHNDSAVLLYSAAEHPSVRENAMALEQLGIPCAPIGVKADGRTSAAFLERALLKNPGARMAAIMAVNNETGAINDIKALSAIVRQRPGFHLHCDAVQAAGKIPLDLHGWGVDSASISAHKIGGSRGMGILWLKSPLTVLFRGGGQENKIRPGTENTAGAINLARVLEKKLGTAVTGGTAFPSLYREAQERMKALMAALRDTGSFIPIPADRNDEDSRFSPWILQGAFRNNKGIIIPGEVLVRALDERGFAISTGSACSSAEKKRPVLDSMGLDKETSFGGVRISQGSTTTMEEINALTEAIAFLCRTL